MPWCSPAGVSKCLKPSPPKARRRPVHRSLCRPTAATRPRSTAVGDPASIKALFAKTKERYGRLDLLFNNAGIGAPAMPIEQIPLDKWQAVVATNFTGVFLCTQEAIKIMKAQTH